MSQSSEVELPQEMKHFLQTQQGTDKVEGTIREYRNGLEQFSEWLDREGLAYEEVDHRDVKRYLTFLKNEKNYAPKTIRGRFTDISQFYKDITENGTDFDDPTEPVRGSPSMPRKSPVKPR